MALRQITRDIVSGVIMSSDDKILFGKQDTSKGGVYTDCWHIPGGGLEPDETKEEGLFREVMEESGLDITKAEVKLIDDSMRGTAEKVLKDTGEKVICNMNFNDYLVKLPLRAEEVKLNPTDDLVELRWMNISELKTIKLTPPSIELFTKMGYLS